MHNRPTPKFSIITVTYNAEAVLEDTIQSVISQTYHHVEYIIIDGASKDRTLAIAERYRDRITLLVSEPDKGLYDAMNKGIHLATGDYLCFLNAGDSFHEDDTLQQMVHTLGIGELAIPYDMQYRFSADFDWCIRIMKKARTLHNTHLTLIDYLEEGMTTQNQKASLRERFRIMAKHYGLISTAAHHAWFVFRLLLKK